MAYSDDYLEGVRLFNTEHFWHAHEAWERCWLAAAEPDATFYKGIIQAAAALVKWQQGNISGMGLNWHKSEQKLARLPASYQGIDLAAFRASMQAFVLAQQHEQKDRITGVPRLCLDEMARHS